MSGVTSLLSSEPLVSMTESSLDLLLADMSSFLLKSTSVLMGSPGVVSDDIGDGVGISLRISTELSSAGGLLSRRLLSLPGSL